ncbi:putative quinol monooxygenase [Rouxiella sp. Mn2063]|uniref:putative quinol monooxygenase n=1 Tax=Rouxiella sp. Mn2063 TaxID=3395262 RepID=UPI003BE495BC
MITVIAEITVKPGRRDAVLERIHQLLPSVLAEDGCHRYEPYTDVQDQLSWRKDAPDSIFMLEEWESVAHLEAHLKIEHMNAHRERIKDDVVNVTISVLNKS